MIDGATKRRQDGPSVRSSPSTSATSAALTINCNASAAGQNPDPPPIPASFVCINGQLGRLELENKVRTLLEPLQREVGGSIDVALILTENRAVYTKSRFDRLGNGNSPTFGSYKEAVNFMKEHGYNVLTTQPEKHLEDPTVYPEYLRRLAQFLPDHKMRDPKVFEYDRRRAQNHLRQAVLKERCWRHMMDTGRDYSGGVVAHFRDDVGFQNVLPIAKLQKLLKDPPPVERELDMGFGRVKGKRPVIVTAYCANWYGMNDRGAFVSPGGAYAYFNAPALAFAKSMPLPAPYVCSNEKLLRYLYSLEGFIFAPSRDLYPVPMHQSSNGTGMFRKSEIEDMQCRNWWNSYHVMGCPRENETIELL